MFGRLSLGRGSGSATNVTLNLASSSVSSFTIHYEQICGGLIGKFEMTALDPTNSGQYGTLNINQSGVASFLVPIMLLLHSSAITADGYQTADSGDRRIYWLGGSHGNKLTMTDFSKFTSGDVTFYQSLSPYEYSKILCASFIFRFYFRNKHARLGAMGQCNYWIRPIQVRYILSHFPKVITITDSIVSTDLLTLGVACNTIIGYGRYFLIFND